MVNFQLTVKSTDSPTCNRQSGDDFRQPVLAAAKHGAQHHKAQQPGDDRPGVAAFHGAGGNENYLADPLLKALAQSGRQPDMVVAALKSSGDNWAAKDETNIISFIILLIFCCI